MALALAPLGAQGDGFKPLFDGKTLDGWRGYKKADASDTRWKVENGLVTIPEKDGEDTRGGARHHHHRHLRPVRPPVGVEDRRRAATAASSTSSSRIETSAIGHEYQMIDDERHADAKIGPHRQTAAFYDVLPGRRPAAEAGRASGTAREVIVKGNHVEHWLNGKRVLQYELDSPELQAPPSPRASSRTSPASASRRRGTS